MFSTLKLQIMAGLAGLFGVMMLIIKMLTGKNKQLKQEVVLAEEKEEIRDEIDDGKKEADKVEDEILKEANPDIDDMRRDI